MANISNPLWVQNINMGKNTKISAHDSREDYKNGITTDMSSANKNKNINSIINKVKALDGDDSNLTMLDFVNARKISIFGKNTTIRIDGGAGIASVEMEDGKYYVFDFETKNEKNERVLKELKAKYGKTCDIEDHGDGVSITVKKNCKVNAYELVPNLKDLVENNPDYFDNEDMAAERGMLRKDGSSMSNGELNFCMRYKLEPEVPFFIPYSALSVQ